MLSAENESYKSFDSVDGYVKESLEYNSFESDDNISRIENGKCSPTLDTLQTLAEGM